MSGKIFFWSLTSALAGFLFSTKALGRLVQAYARHRSHRLREACTSKCYHTRSGQASIARHGCRDQPRMFLRTIAAMMMRKAARRRR